MVFYDPCCGSGTTLFVAARAGMQCIGSDINGDCIEGAAVNLRYALNETFT
eukprot:gene21322-22156_t